MKTSVVIFCLNLFVCCTSNAQTENSDPMVIAEKFFNTYRSDNNAALDYIFSTNRWINKTDVASVKDKLNSLISQLGRYQGEELVTKKRIGKNYVLYLYMIKYDRQPIKFLLTFYKAKDFWQLQNFEFDPDLETELKEAASAYRLPENLDIDK